MNNELTCSFCGKPQSEVHKLIDGPNVAICDDCIGLCSEILKEDREEHMTGDMPPFTPREISELLDTYVIGQRQAKKILSVAVYNHFKRIGVVERKKDGVELVKSNILLIGPTGCGKTYLAETLAKILDVPFTIADATTLTEAGYIGEDVENIIQKLLQKCDFDIEKTERGIVYIDEIDKISRRSEHRSIVRDVSGEGVQQALLKLIEGTVASVPTQIGRKHPQQERLQVDTTNILFICGGAFDGLEKIIEQRSLGTSNIGFSAVIKSKEVRNRGDILHDIEPRDLIRYGLIPEFVGRLPIIATLDELDEKALIEILSRPKNAILKQYQNMFKMEGCELEFREGARKAVAQKARERGTGARGLRTIMEQVLSDIMYDLPSKRDITRIVIDENVVMEGKEPTMVRDGTLSKTSTRPSQETDPKSKK